MAQFEETMQEMGGLSPLDAPVPGESLTADPDTKASYETPPQHTDVNVAMEDLFMRLSQEEALDQVLNLMRSEVPLEDIAQTLLFGGFREGKFNPDLMLMMIEPTIYILLWFAEYADIEPVLYPEDEVGEQFDAEDFDIQTAAAPEGVSEDLLSKIKARGDK
jgi:hypothetical protein